MGRPRKYHTEEERLAAQRAGCRRYYARNRKRLNAKRAAYRRANPERGRASTSKWYFAHKEASFARTRAWRGDNPDKIAAIEARSALNKRKHKFFIAGCVLIDALAAGGDETKRQGGT